MEANIAAAWVHCAAGSRGAMLARSEAATVGVFPEGPERDVYNNAVLARGLDSPQVDGAIESVEQLYTTAGIDRFAIWAHSAEPAALAALAERDYVVDTTTCAMAMPLEPITPSPPDHDIRPGTWVEYLGVLDREGAPAGLLEGVAPDVFHVRLGFVDDEPLPVAAALAFDHDGDCGIYNAGTMPHARRRGLATALVVAHLDDARRRGCETASLHSTEMAERLYASAGFVDLGRFIEYVPA
jgi:ribosomal protein S18 acetylase RimI-like enzyme